MKQSTGLLLSLGQLAAVGSALDIRADVKLECFALDAVVEHKDPFNARGACSYECVNSGHSVMALRGQDCVCLDSLPSDDKKVDPSECNEPCPGYGLETCGGRPGYYSVGLIDASYFGSSNTTNTTATTSPATASSTASTTSIVSSSSVPSNSTGSVTPPSASGSSASASPTIEGSSAAAPSFGSSVTVVSSFVCAVAALVACI